METSIYLHQLWNSTFGLTLAVLSPAWSHMHRRLLRQPQSWQSCSLASHFTPLQASEDQILLVSWLRPFMNLRLSRHCALDVYVSVGIAPLTFIQTGVTLVESAHNTIPCLDWESCFSSLLMGNAGDGHLHHVHYIPVLHLPAASKVQIVDAL